MVWHKKLQALTAAQLAGDTYYFGQLCAKHPELGGKRFTCNCNCTGCNKDKHARAKLRKLQRQESRT